MRLEDLDDILGSDISFRPSRRERVVDRLEEDRLTRIGRDDGYTTDVSQGVSIGWLVKAFRMNRGTVEQRLRTCPHFRKHRNGGLYYDLATAAEFLVVPRTSVEEYLKTMKSTELPKELSDKYWSAKLKEQKWRVNAGELWPTENVLDALSETFKTIKNTVQLWTDTVDETKGLTDAQRELVIHLSDRLLEDIYERLVTNARSEVTDSQLAELGDD